MKVMDREVIEILNNKEEEVINKNLQEEIIMKVKPDQEEEMQQNAVKSAKKKDLRRLAQAWISKRQYKDYELYVTVEEEELMIATVGNKLDKEDKDEEVLATVAHYAMAHYAKKKGIKKKHKPKSGQYPSEAGIKWFGEQGETAVTKELNQFNKYKVFKPQDANDLSEKDKKKALPSLLFLNKN
jgi:hypothetical protein